MRKNPQKPQKEPKSQRSEKIQKIDASGRILGRLSTEIAIILQGKNKPIFRPNIVLGDKVLIINAAKIKVTGSKMTKKIYYHHTGYLGHLKAQTMKEVYQKDPAEVIRRAVYGMLPKNKLRKIWLKNLEIRNGEE